MYLIGAIIIFRVCIIFTLLLLYFKCCLMTKIIIIYINTVLLLIIILLFYRSLKADNTIFILVNILGARNCL